MKKGTDPFFEHSEQKLPDIDAVTERTNRLARILSAWTTEPGYQDADGNPVPLPIRGPAPSLQALSHGHRRDVPPRAIADGLVHVGAAKLQHFTLHFMSPVVLNDRMSDEDISVLTQHYADFSETIQQSFDSTRLIGPKVRQTFFDDIDPDAIPEVRQKLSELMEKAHDEYRKVLKDARVSVGKKGVRFGMGSYTFPMP